MQEEPKKRVTRRRIVQRRGAVKSPERSISHCFMLVCVGLISAVFVAASPAHAGGVDVSIGFFLPFPGYVVPPVVALPAPAVVAPPPVVVYEQPAVVYEQPVVIAPYPHGYYYRPLPPGFAQKYHRHHGY